MKPILRTTLTLATCAFAHVGVAGSAHAQAERSETHETDASDSDANRTEMRAHHRRGIELYDEGDYRLALVEFERAYAISPSYKILFNIGQVHLELRAYARARSALEKYLAEGGAQIPEERRRSVEKDLAMLRLRTARVVVRTNVPDAEITFNDARVDASPPTGAVVDAGVVRVRVAREGYVARTQELALAGDDVKMLSFDLIEAARTPPSHVRSGVSGEALAAWIVTGVLGAGGIGMGIAAASASSEYESRRTAPIVGSPAEARADLERRRDGVGTLALATDALLVSSVIAGGIALYLTLHDRGRPNPARTAATPLVWGF